MDQMEVIVDGKKEMRTIDYIDMTAKPFPRQVPVRGSGEQVHYTVTGEVYIVKSKPWNRLP